MLGKKRGTKSKKSSDSKTDKFLLKLYEILNNEEYNKIIHWSKNGSYIIITNIHLFTRKILPIYFNHQNYSSFVRQLNMYNFHKIRTNPNKTEQYFIHESFNKNKSLREIKNFKRKTKKEGEPNIKCLFFEDEDSKIKYTILENKKKDKNGNKYTLEENIENIQNLNLAQTDEKKIQSFENIIKRGNLDFDMKNKMLLFLMNISKENSEKQKEYIVKLKEISEQRHNINKKIQENNNEIENHCLFLKKIKDLYIFLVNLLMRNNGNSQRVENKINNTGGSGEERGERGNNNIETNKNNKLGGGKKKLVDFIHRYIDYHEKNRIGFSPIINHKLNNGNKNNNNKKNNYHKNKYFSNIVQKGEAFSINHHNFDDYLNKIELISFKSGKLNDSFSFSGEDKNFNSSFSVVGNNYLFNNGNINLNQNFLNDQNLITHNFNNNNYNNNISNSFNNSFCL